MDKCTTCALFCPVAPWCKKSESLYAWVEEEAEPKNNSTAAAVVYKELRGYLEAVFESEERSPHLMPRSRNLTSKRGRGVRVR